MSLSTSFFPSLTRKKNSSLPSQGFTVVLVINPKPLPEVTEYQRTVFFHFKMTWKILSETEKDQNVIITVLRQSLTWINIPLYTRSSKQLISESANKVSSRGNE